jgi:hypothetical protein
MTLYILHNLEYILLLVIILLTVMTELFNTDKTFLSRVEYRCWYPAPSGPRAITGSVVVAHNTAWPDLVHLTERLEKYVGYTKCAVVNTLPPRDTLPTHYSLHKTLIH